MSSNPYNDQHFLSLSDVTQHATALHRLTAFTIPLSKGYNTSLSYECKVTGLLLLLSETLLEIVLYKKMGDYNMKELLFIMYIMLFDEKWEPLTYL